jgi:hypothetical protein
MPVENKTVTLYFDGKQQKYKFPGDRAVGNKYEKKEITAVNNIFLKAS